jgi:heme exporter protein A
VPGWAIDAEGVTKSFGQKPALRGIELKVKRGDLSKPDSGRILVEGLDIRNNAVEVRRSIGTVTHQTFLYDSLTAHENLKFYGRMFAVPRLEERIQEVIAQVGLTCRLHDRVRTFSRGLLQRLSIARAILHHPHILLLDEPETGLDQKALELLKEALDTLSEDERTVVMTTHNLERGLALGDRAIILVEGRVVFEERKQALDLALFRETYRQLVEARE